ncbi:MAG: DUF481 domain-containing protein [Cellvibrionaceae bacterium]
MKQFFCCLLLGLFLAPLTFGDELVLRNGDRIEGELVRIQGEDLVWHSPVLGEVSLKASEIDRVDVSSAVKLDGHAQPCYWLSMSQGILEFECEDGDRGYVDIMSLDLVMPYSVYEGGDYNYRGKLTVSGRQRSGNNEEKNWVADSETLFRRGDFRHETRLRYNSITLNEADPERRGDARYSLDWFFDERWFWYNNLQFGFDEPASIDERYIYGTGVGYQLWETSVSALSLETGFDYVKEHFIEPAMPTDAFEPTSEAAAWRWAVDYRKLLPLNASLFHKHQLIKSLEESNDWLLETETGVSLPINGRLSTEIKVEYDVNNLPVEGNRREDKQISVGVGYSW